jgi:hypothetical protein
MLVYMPGDVREGDPLVEWLREGGLQALDFAMAGALDVIGVVDLRPTSRAKR